MPDPKLKGAMQEIEEILKSHDVAGMVLISSPTSIEFLNFFPTWTCLTFNPQTKELRLKCKRSDYPNEDSHKRILTDSIGTLMGFIDASRERADAMEQLVIRISQDVRIEHFTRLDPPEDE